VLLVPVLAKVAEEDVLRIRRHRQARSPVDVVQLDDGYQAEIGDWLSLSSRFRSVEEWSQRSAHRAGGPASGRAVPGRGTVAGRVPPPRLAGGRAASRSAPAGTGSRSCTSSIRPIRRGGVSRRSVCHLPDLGIDFFKIDFHLRRRDDGTTPRGHPALVAYRTGLR
jgi:alpha-galactosidase